MVFSISTGLQRYAMRSGTKTFYIQDHEGIRQVATIFDDARHDRFRCFGMSEEADRWLRCISVEDSREHAASSVYGGAKCLEPAGP